MRYLSRVHVLVIMLFLMLLNASCGSSLGGKKDGSFPNFLVHPETNDLNESIEIRINPYDKNTFRIGDKVVLEILKKTDKAIYFPANENIQIFQYDTATQNWVEIKNLIRYPGDGFTLERKGRDNMNTMSVIFRPELKSQKEVEIRVAVTGYVVENGRITEKAVTAYIDVKMSPKTNKTRDG